MQMLKRYDCLVPGCKWHAESADTADIVGRAVDHMRDVHGETVVRPEMIGRIKARIGDVQPAH